MYLLSTTATNVTIADLSDTNGSAVVFTHPTVNFDLLSKYSTDDLLRSADLEAALLNGDITITYLGTSITTVTTIGIGPGYSSTQIQNIAFPEPIISNTTPIGMFVSTPGTVIIEGSYFTPSAIVTITNGFVVNSVTFVNESTLQLNVSPPSTPATGDITITDNGGSVIWVGGITAVISTWIDLRSGGDPLTIGNAAGNDVRIASGMTATRDAQGMFFSGSNPWSSWAKFESLGFVRGSNTTVEWIFTNPTSSMMIGIASDQTNETSTSQFSQFETTAFLQSAVQFWGLYGNNGTIGAAGNQNNPTSITAGGVYKVRFEGDGSTGQTFTLYQLPSALPADWNDQSNIITTFAIGGTLNPSQTNIFPGIIPINGGSQRFIAVSTS